MGLLQRLTSLLLWGTVCTTFGLFTSVGAIFIGAAILALLYGIIAVMLGPQFIAAGWLIGSPTFFGFPNQFLRALPFVTMERLILGVLIVMVFLRHAFSKRQVKWLPLEFIIIIFLTYALISLALQTNTEKINKDGWLWIQYLMPMTSFIVSRRIEWSDRGLKILLAALTFTGFVITVLGVLQSQFHINVFTMNYQTITEGHVGRAYGAFSSAHTYVATLSIFLTLTLLQFYMYEDKFIRAVLLITIGAMTVGLVLGSTRAPLIGAALAVLVIFIKHRQARPLMLTGGLIALFLGLGFLAVTIDNVDFLIERIFGSRMFSLVSMQGRAAAWATAGNMILDHPLFGVGFGSGAYLMNKAQYLSGIGSLTAEFAEFHAVPHNEYIHVTVMLGFLGISLFLLILVKLVRLMFQIFESSQENELRRHFALYVGAIIIGLMFNSCFSDTYLQDYFWTLAYFLAGIAAGNLDSMTRHSTNNKQGYKSDDAVSYKSE